MLRIIAVLLLIPLLDVMVLALVADQVIGWVPTVLLVVLTALVGMLLVRSEGRHTLSNVQQKLAAGEVPTDELIDGGLLLVAGAFFLTPGLVTDFIGLLLALPPTRYPIRLATKKWVVTPYADAKTRGFATGNVYVGGFPDEGLDGAGPGNPGDGPSSGPSEGASPSGFDRENATDIDFEESADE